MTREATVRWAERADVAALAELFAEEEREHADRTLEPFDPTRIETLRDRLDAGLFGPLAATRALTAFDADERAIGVAYVVRLTPGFRARPGWFLKQFFLTASARNRGLGGRMLDRLVAEAEAEGAERLELHLIDDNHDAGRFYARHGVTVKTDRRVARIELNRSAM